MDSVAIGFLVGLGVLVVAIGIGIFVDAHRYNRTYKTAADGPVQNATVLEVNRVGNGGGFDCLVSVDLGDQVLLPLHTQERRPRGTIQVVVTDADGSLLFVDPWERRLHYWGLNGIGALCVLLGAVLPLWGWRELPPTTPPPDAPCQQAYETFLVNAGGSPGRPSAAARLRTARQNLQSELPTNLHDDVALISLWASFGPVSRSDVQAAGDRLDTYITEHC